MKRILVWVFLVLVFALSPLSGEETRLSSFEFTSTLSLPAVDYGISREKGLWVSSNRGLTWEPRSDGLPVKVAYPFTKPHYQTFISLAADPKNSNRIIVTTLGEIFLSEDAGMSWNRIPTALPIKSAMVITAAALSSQSPNALLIGTAFSGIFETRDRGRSWNRLTTREHPIYRGVGFYEEVASLAYAPLDDTMVYFTTGFEGSNYLLNKQSQVVTPTALLREVKENLAKRSSSGYVGQEKQERMTRAAGKYALYLNSMSGSEPGLSRHLQFLEDHKGNALVIDMKDDLGNITYDSDLTLPGELGAVKNRIALEELLEAAHEKGVYVIGRIVVFQDPHLYRYNEGEYAVWNYAEDAPWGNLLERTDPETEEPVFEQREFWVDPYSEGVWDYNIAVALELQERGIDEVQFDYIRFPTEGDFTEIQYRFRRKGMRKTDAIESFLRKAREQLYIPISIDIFGFNGWYQMGNWNGQNTEIIARYADVICPMYYPSHFPGDFMKDEPYFSRSNKIYSQGTRRAEVMASDQALIRPYVQAFLIGKELEFEEEEYTGYLEEQIEGVREAGAEGYTLWNASNRYYMVDPDLKLSFH